MKGLHGTQQMEVNEWATKNIAKEILADVDNWWKGTGKTRKVKNDPEVSDRLRCWGNQEKKFISSGKGNGESWHLSGADNKPVSSMHAINIKHTHNVCRERTSLVQGMFEVPEGWTCQWKTWAWSPCRFQAPLCRDNDHCECKCCWQGDVFIGKKERVDTHIYRWDREHGNRKDREEEKSWVRCHGRQVMNVSGKTEKDKS